MAVGHVWRIRSRSVVVMQRHGAGRARISCLLLAYGTSKVSCSREATVFAGAPWRPNSMASNLCGG